MRRNMYFLGTSVALVGIMLGSFWQPATDPVDATDPNPAHLSGATPEDLSSFTPEERINITVYENVNRSVVHITTRAVRTDFFLDVTPTEGSGAGSVLDEAGHILTNFHVIEGAQQIQVTLANGTSYPAELVGQDPANDLAVLKIDAPKDTLSPIRFGDSAGLRVGQKVLAIGNPFGLERTLTIGIISSLNRTLPSRKSRTMKSIIQIDAALNQGNSGGPLLDGKSRFIGMNTAIASRTGENTGVGFAIPVNTIKRVVPQLIEKGHVTRPDLGITRVLQTDEGLLIAATRANGPAEQAGLKGFRLVRSQVRRGPYIMEQERIDHSEADMIIGIDGKQIRTVDDLLTLVERKKPGDEVRVNVVRDGRQVAVPVILGEAE